MPGLSIIKEYKIDWMVRNIKIFRYLHFQYINNLQYNNDKNGHFMMFIYNNQNERLLFLNIKYDDNKEYFTFYGIDFNMQEKIILI